MNNHILVLDISSKTTGYSIVQINDKTLTFVEVGAIFCPITWTEHGRYYKHLIDFVVDKVSNKDYSIHKVVAEAYFVSPFKGLGTSIVTEAIGSVKASCYFPTPPLLFESIAPQAWRGALKIKKDDNLKGPARFKVPTKKRLEELLKITFPEKAYDALGNKYRKMPTDLIDAVGIAMGYFLKTEGIDKYEFKQDAIKIKQD